ncbi:IclR family transcriptional regulator [Rhizobium rhizogenes]|uniref:IclR family transcriptional regulator n=1 Tax=Rhizobium rhizogenes TaxID=359 RepID=UPI00157358B3|nr:IclR family transcriptional regulator [Rhizobium rhizogenes]NTH21849.1 IclR family transcriptional regulator [Rhizobium rhizogenes]NTH34992.1 IclR family transcriptional regulator [Rhizobium rhizogenes]
MKRTTSVAKENSSEGAAQSLRAAERVEPASEIGKKDRQFVVALGRGLQILDCFSRSELELSGTDIAAKLKLPQSTVWRLCRTMVKLGYLETSGEGRLRPSLSTLRLGYVPLSNLTITELARPHLQDLADEIGGAAGLAVRDGSDLRFVERCESDSKFLMSIRVGSRVPIAMSAIGWAYLAALPSDEREATITEVKPHDKDLWIRSEAPLRLSLKAFETDGFILTEGLFYPGYVSIAAPVRGPDGMPVLMINCGAASSTLAPDLPRSKIGPRVHEVARLLESVLVSINPKELHIW